MESNKHSKIINLQKPDNEWTLITKDYVSEIEIDGKKALKIDPKAISLLSQVAFEDISHYLRTSHIKQLCEALEDEEASANDKNTIYRLLQNSLVSAEGVLPMCQDTGTAIVMGKKGQYVVTHADDEDYISEGVFQAYNNKNLRYSQLSPVDMFKEVNTKTNLPAQIEIYSTNGNEYNFLFIAKGGGSANKTFLFQQTSAILSEEKLTNFLKEEIAKIGTTACPPYHLAIVIGGTSAEYTLKTTKLASARYLDSLPSKGGEKGEAYRDKEFEEKILKIAQQNHIGAQFGGKYFCLDVRVIRLPRHGASLPIGIGVSCSADRQALGKITKEGVFIEKLEKNPEKYFIDNKVKNQSNLVKIDLNKGIKEVTKELTKYPIMTAFSLSGTLIVARDLAHFKIRENFEKTGNIPEYFLKYPIYYAGPAKTPKGYVSGSFGPTTAMRMDPYVSYFQPHGASLITIAKGNRGDSVTESCKQNGGFYLGTIGGIGALVAKTNIKNVECVDYDELGMEAVWKIDVEDFPVTMLIDDKGNNFFNEIKK